MADQPDPRVEAVDRAIRDLTTRVEVLEGFLQERYP